MTPCFFVSFFYFVLYVHCHSKEFFIVGANLIIVCFFCFLDMDFTKGSNNPDKYPLLEAIRLVTGLYLFTFFFLLETSVYITNI